MISWNRWNLLRNQVGAGQSPEVSH